MLIVYSFQPIASASPDLDFGFDLDLFLSFSLSHSPIYMARIMREYFLDFVFSTTITITTTTKQS